MSFLTRLNNLFPEQKAAFKIPPLEETARTFGFNGVTLYPVNNGDSYIKKGYNKNHHVYSIVAKNARKLAQVAMYHIRIKNNERKTWNEYLTLTKNGVTSENIKELKRMRVKSIEENKVDSELSKLLKKPNRYQTGAMFREQLYGFKQLTGEGNIYIVREGKSKPKELLIVPKGLLQLKTGVDAWDISGYQITVDIGKPEDVPKEQIIQWMYPCYEFDKSTLTHLRGQSPLDSGLLTLQASNVGAERLLKMNENQGAAGLLFRQDPHEAPDITNPTDLQRIIQSRNEINNAINSKDMAGAIAWLTGQYGYLQFGLDAQKLQLIEQSEASFQALCNIFDTPPGLFLKDQTYENLKEAKRNWVWDNIAPAAYSLRDEMNEKLVLLMGLDRDRDFIDCGVMDLPEMAQDLGKQVIALKDAYWLNTDEKRSAIGYEPLNTEDSKKILVPSSYTTLEEVGMPVGGGLDNEMNLLND